MIWLLRIVGYLLLGIWSHLIFSKMKGRIPWQLTIAAWPFLWAYILLVAFVGSVYHVKRGGRN